MPDKLTRVCFRKDKYDGEIIAAFVGAPYSKELPEHRLVFVHEGQHMGGRLDYLKKYTRPAKPKEYKDLLKELTAPPYNYKFKIVSRLS